MIRVFAGVAINLLFVFREKSIESWYLMLSSLMLSFGIPGSGGRMDHVENRRNDWILAGCLSIFICIWIALSSKIFLRACIDYGATTDVALILNIILAGSIIAMEGAAAMGLFLANPVAALVAGVVLALTIAFLVNWANEIFAENL